jgi:hypothetical protein
MQALIILIPVIAVIAVIVFGVVMASQRAGGTSVPAGPPPNPQEFQRIVTEMTRQGRHVHAIKLVRQHTGLGLKEAKAVVDGVAMGHSMWSHPFLARFQAGQPFDRAPQPRIEGPDLAARVRGLKAAGRPEQAVYLVRGETGMSEQEAELFVNSL